MKKSQKGFLKEFKDFINKGSVIDLAVGVIIGAAFGKIVSSIVSDILMPVIGIFLGGINFSALSFDLGNAHITYGNFIQNVVDFLIIAFCIFIVLKLIGRLNRKTAPTSVEDKPVKTIEEKQLEILTEIRDGLKKDK
jgi:large conductance mechanosensitive channel